MRYMKTKLNLSPMLTHSTDVTALTRVDLKMSIGLMMPESIFRIDLLSYLSIKAPV